jgi:hypothetical protein
MILNINSDAVVKHTLRLERLSRSALPVAVRGALNAAAFDVKKNTMPATAKASFIQRKPTFFKAASKVQPAQGFDMKSMKAIVGFVSKGGNDKSVEELEQQEEGGTIGGRSLITTPQARAGGSWNKNVKADLRIKSLKNVINAQKVRFKGADRNKKQKFVRAAIKAKELYGKNAFVLGNIWGSGNQTLSRIDRITFNREKGTVTFKRTPVYTYRKGRKIQVARTNFMKRASLESGLSLEKHYQNEAIKQLKKLK